MLHDTTTHHVHEPAHWSDLTPHQREGVIAGAVLQVGLALTAWADLAYRPARQVNGPKPAWAAVIAVNYIGPLVYFWRGVKHRTSPIP